MTCALESFVSNSHLVPQMGMDSQQSCAHTGTEISHHRHDQVGVEQRVSCVVDMGIIIAMLFAVAKEFAL